MSLSITTKSIFFFGHTIDETNQSLDFAEGAGEIQAILNIRDYTLEEFAIEVVRAMNAAGGQIYSVSVNRTTRKLTISASSNFELLTTSGSRIGTTVFPLMGFTGADKTGADSYEGNNGSGSEYRPQAVFRDYIPFEDSDEAVDSKINESTSGIIETLNFGSRSFMECEIWGITDISQSATSSIETNGTGRIDARVFMSYGRTKAKMEFMQDRDTPATFHSIILEKTRKSKKGTGYQIIKDFGNGIEGYFTTEGLTFRKVD